MPDPFDGFHVAAGDVTRMMAEYIHSLESRPVQGEFRPGKVLEALGGEPPEQGTDLPELLASVRDVVEPNLLHWGHPAFLAYFGSTSSPAGLYGEMLAAAYNVSAMLWQTSPAATELETIVLDWLRQWLGLPACFDGVVYDTASVSTMHALAAAREVLGVGAREMGLTGRADLPLLRVYVSSETHSSVTKAAIALGLGLRSIHQVAVDEDLRMQPAALQAAIEADVRAGFRPCCAVATIGTTSTTSVDPVAEIAAVCARYGVWLHVDAAYGGALGLLPEQRRLLAGCELADSLVVNGHKWLLVPLDFSVLFTRHLGLLKEAFSLTPDYLETERGNSVRNYMDYGVQLGRRFRALKAWLVFKTYGREGLAACIREHMRLARLFASWVDADADFERLAPVPMAVVCFRAIASGAELDGLNERLMRAVNATGEAYLSQTRVKGHFALRMAVGNIRTEERHLRTLWRVLREQLRLATGWCTSWPGT